MKYHSNTQQQGNVLLVMIIGILVSLTLFLAMFITSQRASTSKQYQDLQIPPIAIPTPPPLPERTIIKPIFSPTPVEQNDEFATTSSAEFDLPVDEFATESSTQDNNSEL